MGFRPHPNGGYTNQLRRVGPSEKRVVDRRDIHSSDDGVLFVGNAARIALVSESGLYKLIMRSDKPEARAFQDWVSREVLPSIRKTGSFVTGQASLVENPSIDPLDLMMQQAQLIPQLIGQMKEMRAAPTSSGASVRGARSRPRQQNNGSCGGKSVKLYW